MALFPQKLGTTVCALAAREGLIGGLTSGLSGAWTEARLGIFFSGISSLEENSLPAAGEEVMVTDYSDYLTFGLKDASPATLPGQTGSLFLGVRSTGVVSEALITPPTFRFSDSNGLCSAIGYNGVTEIDGGALSNGALQFPDPEPDSGYCGFYCVKLKINNRGTSTQTVAISVARTEQVTGTDYGKAALTQLMQNATFGTANTVIWNNGSSARSIPTAAWLRIPFYYFRIRVQSLVAIKIAP